MCIWQTRALQEQNSKLAKVEVTYSLLTFQSKSSIQEMIEEKTNFYYIYD